MTKARQVLKMVYKDKTYLVYFDSTKEQNPYMIYSLEYTPFSKRAEKTVLEEYADFYSCLRFFEDEVDAGYVHEGSKI